jgi:two-component system phosphate regulon sensor histidine kinase PhoR
VRRNLFTKLALGFFVLLLCVLLAVDFFADRALQRDYERTGFEQLLAIARIAQSNPPQLTSLSPEKPEEISALQTWMQHIAAGGARVTVITAGGLVLADSQSDPHTMENHAGRPEIVQALAEGSGRSIRHSATINRDLEYYAVRQTSPSGNICILRFALPVKTVGQVLWPFRRSLWLASAIILFGAGVLVVLVSRNFSDRIERLTAFSQRVAEGDFRAQASDDTGDALDVLSDSLNQTAKRLDHTIRSLTEERNLSSAILGSMVEGVLVVNAAERVVFANHSFAEILGMTVPPQAGSGLVEWVRQTELIEAVRKVLAGEPRVESEIVTGTLRQWLRCGLPVRMARCWCCTTSRTCANWNGYGAISWPMFRMNFAHR